MANTEYAKQTREQRQYGIMTVVKQAQEIIKKVTK